MPIKASRTRRLRASLLAFAGAALVLSIASSAQAQESANYTISDNDAYGIADCMHSGSDCGRVMADSWCEAHGHVHALAYGSGQDVTGSLASAGTVIQVASRDVVIRCGN